MLVNGELCIPLLLLSLLIAQEPGQFLPRLLQAQLDDLPRHPVKRRPAAISGPVANSNQPSSPGFNDQPSSPEAVLC